jgi:hypothetical protein
MNEQALFEVIVPLAEREITLCLSADHRRYAEIAVKRARGFGSG